MINEPQDDRTQEWFLMLGDKFAALNRRWVYALIISLILILPLFFISRYIFFLSYHSSYVAPELRNVTAGKEPIEIVSQKIFELTQNNYYAVVTIRNPNFDWGVANQSFIVDFKDEFDMVVANYSGETYILPASTKTLTLPRFSTDKKPIKADITLAEPKFVRPQVTQVGLDISRKNILNHNGQLVVSASVRNTTPYTIKQIDLPVTVFDSQNNLIAASTTNVNSVKSGETRSFQFVWTREFSNAVRAEINPEINLFDRGLFTSELDDGGEVIY